MKLYATPTTRATRAVWALEEADADYEYHKVDLRSGEGRTPEYLALNPGGKVPTLVDGDLVLTESAAICLYIGDKHPDSGLVPPDIVGRARVNQWCFFAIGELEQPMWTKAKHSFAIPSEYRVPDIKPTTEWEFKRATKVLSKGLGESQFILGDTFTVADIMLGHTLAWGLKAFQDLGHENVSDYAQRLFSRPAFARAFEREQS